MNIREGVIMQKGTLYHYNQRWSTVVGRPLSNFEQMKIARPFRYDTETGKWWRVLKPVLGGVPYGYVEVDLSIDAATKSCTLPVCIHTKAASISQDIFLANIPDPDRQLREKLHSTETARWFLYGDVWAAINAEVLNDLYAAKSAERPIRLIEVLKTGVLSEPDSESMR